MNLTANLNSYESGKGEKWKKKIRIEIEIGIWIEK